MQLTETVFTDSSERITSETATTDMSKHEFSTSFFPQQPPINIIKSVYQWIH